MGVRLATPADAPEIGRLLDQFNTEFGDPTPGPEAIAERAREMLERDELVVFLAGEPAVGIASMLFRVSIWSPTRDAYLEELYVEPPRRGDGLGRALLEAAMDAARERGATRIELNTGETDAAARRLYEAAGFTNREGDPDGPSMLYYERDL